MFMFCRAGFNFLLKYNTAGGIHTYYGLPGQVSHFLYHSLHENICDSRNLFITYILSNYKFPDFSPHPSKLYHTSYSSKTERRAHTQSDAPGPLQRASPPQQFWSHTSGTFGIPQIILQMNLRIHRKKQVDWHCSTPRILPCWPPMQCKLCSFVPFRDFTSKRAKGMMSLSTLYMIVYGHSWINRTQHTKILQYVGVVPRLLILTFYMFQLKLSTFKLQKPFILMGWSTNFDTIMIFE